jgi:hypothetical protein
MAKTGFNYYCVDTDIYQDRKIKRLKKRCGCVGMCVYQYILCEVFRVRGYMLEWDDDTIFDIAECFGLEEAEVLEAVEYMAEVGLFDSAKLAQGVITSASIQRRYYEMSDKAKRKGATIPSEVVLYVPENAQNAIPEKSAEIPEETAEIPEEIEKFGNNSEETAEIRGFEQQSKVKKSKVKKSKVNNISLSACACEHTDNDTQSEEVAEVSATERERIFEILFFDKNCKNPEAEVNALIGYYTANGWRRSNGAPIHDRAAVASTWIPEDKAPRIPTLLLDWLKLLHTKAKKENSADASAIIHGIYGAKVGFKDGRTHFTVSTTPEARAAMERHIIPSARFSLTISTVNG